MAEFTDSTFLANGIINELNDSSVCGGSRGIAVKVSPQLRSRILLQQETNEIFM